MRMKAKIARKAVVTRILICAPFTKQKAPRIEMPGFAPKNGK
jgi:hypothetical protein